MIACETQSAAPTPRLRRNMGMCEEGEPQLCTSGAGRKSNPPGGRRTSTAAGFDESNEDNEIPYWLDTTEDTEA
jgi:hypothetical protein